MVDCAATRPGAARRPRRSGERPATALPMTSTASAAPPAKSPIAGMSPRERRSSMTLASIYGLRMLGLFLILPVFAIYTRDLPGGNNHALVGLALGIYGLTQAMLQIPFGIASDRFGRKPVMMIGLLIFAVGSFMAGGSRTLTGIIVGRAVQGAGAISARSEERRVGKECRSRWSPY